MKNAFPGEPTFLYRIAPSAPAIATPVAIGCSAVHFRMIRPYLDAVSYTCFPRASKFKFEPIGIRTDISIYRLVRASSSRSRYAAALICNSSPSERSGFSRLYIRYRPPAGCQSPPLGGGREAGGGYTRRPLGLRYFLGIFCYR